MAKENKSAVKNLIDAVEEFLDVYASNLKLKAKGKEPKFELDEKKFNEVMKIVDNMSKLDYFDKLANGQVQPAIKTTITTETTTTDDIVPGENIFEQRSKAVKAKLNASPQAI